jgi:RNA polymerase sigma-70 factor (ECF subfamily)
MIDHAHGEVLDRLYRDSWRDVCRLVHSRFGPGPPEPEEIAQAAFERLAAVKSPQMIRNPRNFLFTVAINIAHDQRRRAVTRTAVDREIANHNQEVDVSEATPECVLEAKQRFEIFKLALSRMSAVRRRVFLLIRIEGVSVSEVAQQFCISEAAVYKHISRAMHDCLLALNDGGPR